VGEEDISTPPPLSNRIHDRLPHSTFLLIPGAGHLSALKWPALVNEAILGFLAAHANWSDVA
jgi:pimeloyl-ACP methyl ester carboxylesterase